MNNYNCCFQQFEWIGNINNYLLNTILWWETCPMVNICMCYIIRRHIIKSCLIFLIIAKKYQSFVSHNYTIIGLEGDVWERRKQCFRLQHYIDKKWAHITLFSTYHFTPIKRTLLWRSILCHLPNFSITK